MAAMVAAALITGVTSPVAAAPTGVDPDGRWSAVENWPLISIHSALTPDGNVVTFGTNGTGRQGGSFIYDVWDSTGSAGAGHSTLTNTTSTDLFCSIQVVRPDSGDLVMFGGDNVDGGFTTNTGNPDITVYDTATSTLTTTGAMQRNRWYATSITRPDGSVYIQGGWDDPDGFYGNDIAELWTEGTGSVALPFATDHLWYFYPRLFQLSDGRIFGYDVKGKMFYISADLQTLTDVGTLDWVNRGFGSSGVMYETDKILQFGGNGNEAVIIDPTGATPTVTSTGNISQRRDWVDGTLLPDGRVLATGGSQVPNDLVGVALSAEIWDPATGVWTMAADGAEPRLYHSTSLLLPDGRVLVAGGGAPGPVKQLNAEIYSPDYLVAADGSDMPRPAITSVASGPYRPGDPVVVTVDDATDINQVTLLKTGSVTHSFNVDQRFIDMAFTANGNDLTITLPTNAGELTPGHWLVTVIDDDGIPSPSEIVQVMPPLVEVAGGSASVIEGDTPDTAVVSVPVTLSAPSLEPVMVDWATVDVPADPAYADSTTGDYDAAAGTLTFAPGTTSLDIDVTVNGDLTDEDDELIRIDLTNPVSATLELGAETATGTITDDDDPPVIAPSGDATTEGNTGSVQLDVPLTLSHPSAFPITVDYVANTFTGPGVADVGVDFDVTPGTVTFQPGETEATAPVTVHGDTDIEAPLLWGEWALVAFSNPTNATLDLGFFGLGVAVIIDDD